MSEKSLKDLIEEQFETDSLQLPVFNRVAVELQKLKSADNVGMDQIAALIERDQSLASRVLRVANSSFYGGLRKVETVRMAAVRLGLERVTNLTMVVSQLMAHSSRNKRFAAKMHAMWLRSYAAAVGCRWIAERSGYAGRVEEAFLAGLLHDIGELFLLKVLDKLAQQKEDPLEFSEPLIREVMEVMHADVGSRLMLKWELPEQYARMAARHHDDDVDESDPLLMMVRLMDVACQKIGIGQPAEPDIVLAATAEAHLLGLKDIKLAELEVMLEDAIAQAEGLAA